MQNVYRTLVIYTVILHCRVEVKSFYFKGFLFQFPFFLQQSLYGASIHTPCPQHMQLHNYTSCWQVVCLLNKKIWNSLKGNWNWKLLLKRNLKWNCSWGFMRDGFAALWCQSLRIRKKGILQVFFLFVFLSPILPSRLGSIPVPSKELEFIMLEIC